MDVNYLERDLGSTAAIAFHMSLKYVPVSMWQCHCLIFCKVTHLRMFKEQKRIIRFGLNQASDTGRMGGHEGGQRWSGTYNSISYLLYVLDKLPLFSLSVTIS